MKSLKSFSIKTAAIALTVSSLFMAGNVQAHHHDGYQPQPLLTYYNVLIRTRHHQHSRHHSHYHKAVRHSHSHSRYSGKRLIKKHRVF